MAEALPADTTCIVGFGRSGQALARALGPRPWIALDRGGGPGCARWLAEARRPPRRPAHHVEVVEISRSREGFALTLGDGVQLVTRRVVIATGRTGGWEAPQDLAGGARHLGEPDLGLPGPGQQVLVIGAGPLPLRAAQRLWERGVKVALSLPGPAPLLSPALAPWRPLGRVLSRLPARLGGWITRRGLRDLRAWDWPLANPDRASGFGAGIDDASGQITDISSSIEPLDGTAAVAYDTGLAQLVRQGAVIIYPPVSRLALPRVVFEDGREDRFDACLVPPRASPGLGALLSPALARDHLDADGQPRAPGTLRDGLGFIGFSGARTSAPTPLARQAAALAAALAR